MTEEILRLVPAGETYILVDEERWWAGLAADGRRRLPFLERDGVYWGRPEDDRTAVDELLRLKRAGARYMLFAESAFWWLDHYRTLASHLQRFVRLVLDTPHRRGYAL